MAFFIYTYTTFVSRSLMMMMMKKIQSQCSPRQNNQGLLFEIIFLRWQSKKKAKNPHPSILFWKNKKTNPKTLLSQLKF